MAVVVLACGNPLNGFETSLLAAGVVLFMVSLWFDRKKNVR